MCEPVCRSLTSGANSGEFQKRSADSRSGNSRMIAPSGGVSSPSICVGSPPCTKNRPPFAAIRALVFGRYSASQSRCEIRSRPTMYAAIAERYSPTETRRRTDPAKPKTAERDYAVLRLGRYRPGQRGIRAILLGAQACRLVNDVGRLGTTKSPSDSYPKMQIRQWNEPLDRPSVRT
jgi:hypothetical protein